VDGTECHATECLLQLPCSLGTLTYLVLAGGKPTGPKYGAGGAVGNCWPTGMVEQRAAAGPEAAYFRPLQ
jgi:hypothetical protein